MFEGDDLAPGVRVPCVGLPGLDFEVSQDDVEGEEYEEARRLADGRQIPTEERNSPFSVI